MRGATIVTGLLLTAVVVGGAPAPAAADTELERIAKAAGRTAETCGADFKDRLAEARQAIPAQDAYMRDYNRVMPWFYAHCRFLSELERAVRKLDDPAAFVCEKAKGRPAGLTSKFVLEHSAAASVSEFQDHSTDNMLCRPFDPVSLYLADAPADDDAPKEVKLAAAMHLLEVMCFGSTKESCVKAREQIAAAKKKTAEKKEAAEKKE